MPVIPRRTLLAFPLLRPFRRMSDYADWQTPQAHATAISKTGAPLLRLNTNVGSASTVLTPGTNIILSPTGPFTQPSFTLYLKAIAASALMTVPYAQVYFTWTDTASGIGMTRAYSIAVGAPANPIVTVIRGICLGDSATLLASNNDPSVNISLTWSLNQTSHLIDFDRLVEFGIQPFPASAALVRPEAGGAYGSSMAGTFTAGGISAICATSALAAGSSAVFILPAVSGQAVLKVPGIAGSALLNLQDPANLYDTVTADRAFTSVNFTATGQVIPVNLPYGPVALKIMNTATTGTLTTVATMTTAGV